MVRPVSEPDSELSARSDIPERSFLRAIKISYEIVLDAAWQVSQGPHTELKIISQEQFLNLARTLLDGLEKAYSSWF